MTILHSEQGHMADPGSPLARVLLRAAAWSETRHRARVARETLRRIPEDLRDDVGLDGGARLARRRSGGRSFVHDEQPGAGRGWWDA